MIGRYKLLQKIGEGGMGVVYMAEQTEPVVRKVALKIIKLGMDTKQVVARFEAERQALALMDHPNIAKVLDAGTTESVVHESAGRARHSVRAETPRPESGAQGTDAPYPPNAVMSAGRPYFVMELVHGVPITEYSDKNKLSTQQRLELFIPVCQAIQHAHQKGIIHRDIKPSNVMVTLHDGVPVPKVIDFGVAKATNQRLTEKTLFTHYAQIIGTPAYMSPEQAEMSGLDIDTRSDIYSLGVLLYELLTGSTPFDAKELLSKGYAEMQRIIAEQEPVKPSTRMSTLTDEERTVVAKNRNVEESALRKVLQGDLDWIVMKCLEKDRTRRYETSNGLAADLRRHLDNELITARPPTTGYLLKKLIKRNKVAVATAAIVAASFVIGIAATTWQAVRATRAEALAKERLAESEAITKFLTGVFQSPDPVRDGRTITVAETLDTAVKNLDRDLAAQPALRAQLQTTLGRTYIALGLARETIPLWEKVREYWLTSFGQENTNTLSAMLELAISYDAAGRWEEAIKLGEEAFALSQKIHGTEGATTLAAMGNLANSYNHAGRQKEALKLREEGLPLSQKVNGLEDPDTLTAMRNLAISYQADGQQDKALKLLEEVLTLSRKVLGPKNPDALGVMHNLANSYAYGDRLDEAIKLLEQELPLTRTVHGPVHDETLGAMTDLALFLAADGRMPEAIALQEQSLTIKRRVLRPDHPFLAQALQNLVRFYAAAHRTDEALAQLAEAVAQDPPDTSAALGLAAHQLWLGKNDDYQATCQRMLKWAADSSQADHAERAAKITCLRPITIPQLQEAVLVLARRAVELGQDNSGLPYYQMTLGMAEYRSGNYPAADQMLRAAMESGQNNYHVKTTAGFYYAMSLFQKGKPAEARQFFAETEAKMKPLPADEQNPMAEGDYADDLILWLADKEAKALLNATSPAKR